MKRKILSFICLIIFAIGLLTITSCGGSGGGSSSSSGSTGISGSGE